MQIIIRLLKCSFFAAAAAAMSDFRFVNCNYVEIFFNSSYHKRFEYLFLVAGDAFEDIRFRETIEYNDADSYNIDDF